MSRCRQIRLVLPLPDMFKTNPFNAVWLQLVLDKSTASNQSQRTFCHVTDVLFPALFGVNFQVSHETLVISAMFIARLQMTSSPDRMTPFSLEHFVKYKRAAAKNYRRAGQNYYFGNIVRQYFRHFYNVKVRMFNDDSRWSSTDMS